MAGAGAALLTRLPHLSDAPTTDASWYLTLGLGWRHGLIPYADLYDNKGPLTPELYTALSFLPRDFLWLRLLLLAAFCVSIWQLAALARRRLGELAAWAVALTYGIAASSTPFDGVDPNTEQWSLPLLVAALDLADRARARSAWLAAASGAAFAAAVALRPTQAPLGLVVLYVLLARDGRREHLAPWLVSAAAVGATLLAPFAINGALDDLWHWTVTDGGAYARFGFHSVTADGAKGWLLYLTTIPAEPLILAGLTLGIVAARDSRVRAVALPALAWVGIAWVTARMTGRSYSHNFVPMLPGLALLVGAGVQVLGARGTGVGRPLVAVVLAATVLPLALIPARDVLAMRLPHIAGGARPQLQRLDDATKVVRRVTRPGDRIWVQSTGYSPGLSIYWYTGRLPAAPTILPAPEYVRGDPVPEVLMRTRPKAIVVFPGAPLEPLYPVLRRYRMRLVARLPAPGAVDTLVYAR